ncbi:uncharacterized protein LOC144630315 isoform X2 [Oculina patagonica]
MFYISPWMAVGLILCTAYFVLVLLGFGRKDNQTKVSEKSDEKLGSSTKTSIDNTEEKQVQLTEEKLEVIKRDKHLQGCKSDTQRQIREISCQISTADKSFEGLQPAPGDIDKDEKLSVEQSATPVKNKAILPSQDALYLQEFNVSKDFITERDRIRENKITTSHADENFSECLSENVEKFDGLESSDVNQDELSDNVTQTLSSSVLSEPVERFDIQSVENEQAVQLSEPGIDVVESHSSTGEKQDSLFGDFAEILVARAKTEAFSNINLESTATVFAEKISAQIVCDAIGQFATAAGQQEVASAKVQEIHSFAGNVVNSLFQGASGKVSLVKDVETFAKDLSEQVINESIEQYAVKEKLEQGRKKKVSLNEMRIFSEGIISEILCDGIDEAVVAQDDSQKDNLDDKDLPEEQNVEDSIPQSADSLTNGLRQSAHQELALSSTIQPHISGVVENLVNGAIYEAALRVKAGRSEPPLEDSDLEGHAQEILESQVDETVRELIVSALNKAADHEGKESELQEELTQENKSELETRLESYVDDALGKAVSEAVVKVTEEQNVPNQEQKVLNGHVDLSQEPVMEQSYQSIPEIVILSENSTDVTDHGEGFDVVPAKENEEKAALREKKTSEGGDYWRRSLILDLEGDEEFDESIESEKSPSPTKDEELISDEESEEFIDSSEDEVIDHAEEAKMGAVGGSNVNKYENYDDDRMDLEDELDDDDDDDEDDDYDMFVPQSMVDGLCVSKPKEKSQKKKKKRKTLPRPRIQSAGSHFNNAVVLDNGCGTIKLGWAGHKKPGVIQPALYGIPKRYSLQMAGMDNRKDRMYGDAAAMKAGVMQLEYPMKAGLIENWSDVEDVWEYMLYDELGIEEGNHPILITEIANTPKKNREKIAEILFEHLSAPAMYLANQLVLSMYASGLTVGVCLSSGFSVTQAAAIYEGYLLQHTVQELDIGGQSLTDNLQKLLRENKGHNFNSSSGWQIVNNMKESKAYVAQDYPSELKQFKTNDALTQFYSLPDGQTVDISSEMITTAEPLFNPETLLGADDTIASQLPVHKLVNNAFRRCSPELQDNIQRNVVLSGGTTLMKGLVPRLQHELSKINPKIRTVRAPDNRRYSAWIGGSILGSLSTMDSMYITIDEYADHGGKIVNQKCF